MTSRSIRYSLAALGLVLQVIVGSGATRAFVICIGPEGHVAIEDSATSGHCNAEPVASRENGTRTIGMPACSDTPVSTGAPDRAPSAARFVAPMLTAFLLPRPAVVPLRAHAGAEAFAERASLIRSVVLRI